MVELLSPVGDFECLKAAVQNGANAVYFGANLFSARAYATNFDNIELEQAINYAKIRGVKTHLTLNTLIKNEEFEDAFLLAKKAYELGIDAIIVQDLGLARYLIKAFPDLDIHASTQMTTTNLEDVLQLQNLGFKRVVLSRECSLSEIKNICNNSNIEIEVFVHGALCICYSGQCLFSSMVGGRSGNRGKCAQPCRLPYSLISEEKNDSKNLQVIDNGYLLSTRDLCSLENLPNLIDAGVTSFKIEGRMKSPTYVATVTRIYRKYIDLAIKFNSGEIKKYEISEKDKQDLMQVFNRGNFSSGHLLDTPNKKLIFKQKPNNMGIYLGKVIKYNSSKGLITVKLENTLSIGDGISLENETSKYTISELLEKSNNIKYASYGQTVTFGRMKGNIKINDKIYKISDKELYSTALNSYSKETKRIALNCTLTIKSGEKIKITINNNNFEYDYIPDVAKSAAITKERIIEQFSKTQNTCFNFSKLNIDLDDNLFIPVSILNDIRRTSLLNFEKNLINSFKRHSSFTFSPISYIGTSNEKQEKSVLLNVLPLSCNYSKLKEFDRIYIPLKYFVDNKYESILHTLSTTSKLYIYMPIVIKDRFLSKIKSIVKQAFESYKIAGAVISDYAGINIFKPYNVDLIANYTFNVYNSFTANELKSLGFLQITMSPELNENEVIPGTEVIGYGKIPIMTMSYCVLGNSNRCYKDCKRLCLTDKKFYLSDRYNFKFRVIPDNIQTLTTIYNSRNINNSCNFASSVRVDILDEELYNAVTK